MKSSLQFRILVAASAVTCLSTLPGCWWHRREPRHDVHEERREERHEERHEEHRR